MFNKILIANRGEIACRVISTAKKMGIATAAVYSEADANALHVEMADEAYPIGGAPATESYLDIVHILDAAHDARADAIHPGYGFLSENPEFATACETAGLTFIGPPADAIRKMGLKHKAKALMSAADVPVVPGYHEEVQDTKTLAAAARDIGYPVLIKPVAGGGGKGMRIVRAPGEFDAALAAARREAAAFGDDRVLIEKYISQPRHIEIQVFADEAGNTVHLFERDCSLQRRHQKIVEEAPAPGMTPELRRAMGRAAVKAAKAIGYVGAGTVEFITTKTLADGTFYFMEMNTRLQVEHPVTEMITGLDLVNWQILVAAGEPLPLSQDKITSSGHAIEARLYAEDPAKGFLPQAGTISALSWPETDESLRIDTGVRGGDDIPVHYDPMIAKVISHGLDRTAAIAKLGSALENTEIAGPATNLEFLRRITAHDAFAAGDIDTGFVDRHLASLTAPFPDIPDEALAFAVLRVLAARAQDHSKASGDPYSPWRRSDGWRLNQPAADVIEFREGDGPAAIDIAVGVAARPDGYRLALPRGGRSVSDVIHDGIKICAEIDGTPKEAKVSQAGTALTVAFDGAEWPLNLVDPLEVAAHQEEAAGSVAAPMPGKIIDVRAKPGAAVKRGETLVVLEAMKMEHGVNAPADGVIEAVHVAVGDQVREGVVLVDFETGDAVPATE